VYGDSRRLAVAISGEIGPFPALVQQSENPSHSMEKACDNSSFLMKENVIKYQKRALPMPYAFAAASPSGAGGGMEEMYVKRNQSLCGKTSGL
jgi:hypothetical protein